MKFQTQPLITIFSAPQALNKTISINQTGKLNKISSANFSTGIATRQEVESFQHLNLIINELPANMALGLGVSDYDEIGITTASNPVQGSIARSKDNFQFTDQATLFYLDIDDSAYSIDDTIEKLFDVIPEFKNVSYFKIASSSGRVKDHGKESYHLYFLADKGTAIANLSDYLNIKLWLAGYGVIKVAKGGALLTRNTLGLDMAVFSPERLVFEANPTLKYGLQLDLSKSEIIEKNNNVVPVSQFAISEEERALYQALIAKAKGRKKPAALKQRKQYFKEYSLTDNDNRLLDEDRIPHNFKLYFDNSDVIRGDQLTSKHDGLTLRCPFDAKNRKCKAIFNWNDGKSTIFSYKMQQSYSVARGATYRNFKAKLTTKKATQTLKPVSLDQGLKQLDTHINDFFNNGVDSCINITCGAGKTARLQNYLFDNLITKNCGHQITILAATHINISEYIAAWDVMLEEYCKGDDFRSKMQRLQARQGLRKITHIRGRTFSGTDQNCKHLLTKGSGDDLKLLKTNITNFCSNCPLAGTCAYVGQFKKENELIRLETHNALVNRGSQHDGATVKTSHKIVIDEDIVPVMVDIKKSNISTDHAIKRVIEDVRLGDTLQQAITKNLDHIQAEIQEYGEYRIKRDDAIADIDFNARSIKDMMINYVPVESVYYSAILKPLLSFKDGDSNIWIDGDVMKFTSGVKNFNKKYEHSKILYLDATANSDVVKATFGDRFKFLNIDIDLNKNITVTQCLTRSNARYKFDADKNAAQIKKLATSDNYGLITYKTEKDELLNLLDNKSVSSGHFGNVRGLNSWQDCNELFVVGRQHIGDGILDYYRAFYAEIPNKERIETTVVHNGSIQRYESNTMRFKEKRLNALYEHFCAAETLQAIHRLRLIHGNANKNLYILTNELLDIQVDNFLFDEVENSYITKMRRYIEKYGSISSKPALIRKALKCTANEVNDNKARCENIFKKQTIMIVGAGRNKKALKSYVL